MKLSPGTRRRVDLLFSRQDRPAAVQILVDECGTGLPSCADCDDHALERVRFAALKVSNGDLALLREAVALAQSDFGGLLAAASFSNERAHESWPTAKRST